MKPKAKSKEFIFKVHNILLLEVVIPAIQMLVVVDVFQKTKNKSTRV